MEIKDNINGELEYLKMKIKQKGIISKLNNYSKIKYFYFC